MLNSDFVHLHVHDEFSQLDGFGKAEDYAKRAKELGFKYISCTDHGNVDGVIKFQQACGKEGIKSIIGCEAYIVPDASIKKKEQRYHITLLVKNQVGWQNLLRMLTYANLEGFYRKPRIDYKCLLSHLEGLVVLTGCSATFLADELGQADSANHRGLSFFWKLEKQHSSDLYLEVMPIDFDPQKNVNRVCQHLSSKYDIPVVATNDCHYIYEDEWEAQEVLLAVQRKAKWTDKDRWKFGMKGLHLRTADEMVKAFREQGVLTNPEIRQAMSNTIEVAEKCCGFRIEKQGVWLPEISLPKKQSEGEVLWGLIYSGYGGGLVADKEEYHNRCAEEFNLIERKGFIRYFLIVHELVQWCKENDIMIGSRGSVAGSLISYLLGITSVDPIEHGLLFSRFISEDRIDLPDIDIDFEHRKRHLVRAHLEELYGHGCVAGISDFLRMKGRMAIRDVARVFDVPEKDIKNFTEIIETEDKIEDKLKKQEGIAFQKKYPKVVKFAQKLEGQIRSSGQHAAGVVISAEDLREGKKCYLINRNDTIVVNWEMEDTEYVGLMKLDVLASAILSIFSETARLVKKNREVEIDFDTISLDDPKVLAEFTKGNTKGVFQFHGHGITDLCKSLKIDSFELLVAANALFRPGPLQSGMMQEFIDRRNGKKFAFIHPIIEEITRDTYGIMIFQEQVIRIANEVAGLSLADADKMRKIIGKSKGKKELRKFRERFVEGCIEKKTLTEKQAEKLWGEVETFGGYGFNRCLHGNSEIELVDCENRKIRDLFEKNFDGLLWSYDWDKKTTVVNKVKNISKSVRNNLVEIKTKSGKMIIVSKEHRMFKQGYEEIVAGELRVGDKLLVEEGEMNACRR